MAASMPGAAATPVSSASARCRSSTTRPGRRASRISCPCPCGFPGSPTWSRSVRATCIRWRCSRTAPCAHGARIRSGQVGDGTTINRDTPTPVQGVRNVVAIAALGYSSVAVLSDGTAMDWGNTHGSSDPRPVPAAVVGARGLRSVVGGGAHVVALTQTGGVMTWGTSGHYETGRGRNASAPGLVKELTDVVSIAASPWASAAVLASGRIMAWSEVRPWHRPGYNGTQQSQSVPDPVVARWTRAALTQFNSQRQRTLFLYSRVGPMRVPNAPTSA